MLRLDRVAIVAICSYSSIMTSVGIRELKDNLSQYVRRIEAGERIAVTAHGRVVAELRPPGKGTRARPRRRYDDLVEAGVVRLPVESGDPLAGWPTVRLPAGSAARLIAEDRGED